MASRPCRCVIVSLLAILAAAALSACGSSSSSSSGSASAQQLLQDTFSGSHPVKSGVLSFNLTFTPSGSSTLNGPISLSLNGPFESPGSGKLPESHFTITLSALGRHGQIGVISTQTSGYVTLNGTAYRLPPADFQKLASSFSTVGSNGSGGGLAKFGIDPRHWVANPAVVGTATVGGSSTTHIRAQINVAALLDDLDTLLHKASSTGASARIPSSISPATRLKIAHRVQNPTIDIWTGTRDHTLRRFSLSLGYPVGGQTSSQLGGLHSIGFGLTLQYADLNQPQTISAPTNVKPFSQFESKVRGIIGQLQGVTGSGSLGSGPSGSSGSGSSAAGVGKYSKCIQNAGGDVTKMQKCAGLLNGSGG